MCPNNLEIYILEAGFEFYVIGSFPTMHLTHISKKDQKRIIALYFSGTFQSLLPKNGFWAWLFGIQRMLLTNCPVSAAFLCSLPAGSFCPDKTCLIIRADSGTLQYAQSPQVRMLSNSRPGKQLFSAELEAELA